jgi:hypothetical protein
MERIKHYVGYRELSCTEFERLYAHPFLLIETDKVVTDKGRFFVPTLTANVGEANRHLDLLEQAKKHGWHLDPDAQQLYLVKIAKRERNPFRDRIIIGRTTLADVIVENSQVSKRHAIIQFDEAAQQFTVTDCGSTNGTTVNGDAVTDHTKTTLRYGDVLTFGTLKAQFLSATQVWELLQKVVVKD